MIALLCFFLTLLASPFKSKSRLEAEKRGAPPCKRLGLKHIRTRPYTPKTNGKAERFIQTALREWAYAKAYERSDHRGAELPIWLHRYNWHRPHGGIGAKPPIADGSTWEQPVEAPHLAWISLADEAHRGSESPKVVVQQPLKAIQGEPRCRRTVA